MSGQHAFLPPSGAAAWVVCHLWPTMNQRYPETTEKPEAMEGTAAHWAASEELYNRPTAVGQVAENGIALTEEMLAGAEIYVEAIRTAYASLSSVSHYEVEQRVLIPAVHAQNDGTPDAWLFGTVQGNPRAQLHVFDFKFGHEFVEVFENWQMVDYTSGIMDKLGIDGHGEQFVDVTFHLVQPRSYHRDGPVRTWRVPAVELRPLVNKLHNAAGAACQPEPEATPDPVACKHCPGRHACRALQTEGYRLMTYAGMSTPLEMPAEAMGLELRMLQRYIALAEARASGLAEQVQHSLESGMSNPHFMMAAGQSKLVWNRPDAEVIALGQLLGVDLAKPPAAITPTQARTKGKLSEDVLGVYAERSRAALQLTPVSMTAARKVFGAANSY